MIKFLISTSETYRVNSEADVDALIEEAKKEGFYILDKYSCVKKEKKVKGEIEDEWYRVTLTKLFNAEKEPTDLIDVKYKKEEFEASF